MGYYSSLSGQIDIDPPLDARELRTCVWLRPTANIHVEISETQVDTDDGVLTKKSGPTLVPYGEHTKAYDLEENVSAFVAEYAGSHRCNGSITVEGEDAGDVWRIRVVNNVVVRETARVVWPDGTEYEATS